MEQKVLLKQSLLLDQSPQSLAQQKTLLFQYVYHHSIFSHLIFLFLLILPNIFLPHFLPLMDRIKHPLPNYYLFSHVYKKTLIILWFFHIYFHVNIIFVMRYISIHKFQQLKNILHWKPCSYQHLHILS